MLHFPCNLKDVKDMLVILRTVGQFTQSRAVPRNSVCCASRLLNFLKEAEKVHSPSHPRHLPAGGDWRAAPAGPLAGWQDLPRAMRLEHLCHGNVGSDLAPLVTVQPDPDAPLHSPLAPAPSHT